MNMDFGERIRELATQVKSQLPHIQTEEATKNALIMPFISVLGYNVFSPTEVTPELHADVGLKKGEKVDYAILVDGKPAILFECKWHGADLSKEHASQLYRYFSVTEARFGILTNGIRYWFFSDIDAANKMDAKPFFKFNLFDYREAEIEELKKFTKSTYNLDDILNTANELKYTNTIMQELEKEFAVPSDEMIRMLLSRVHDGRLTPAVREQYKGTVAKALQQFVSDRVSRRLQTALTVEAASTTNPVGETNESEENANGAAEVVTTTEEIEAFFTVRSILHAHVDPRRIIMRDVRSYCGILLDDNNRKPLCRIYLNRKQKYIGLFDRDDRTEERVAIEDVSQIYSLSERLLNTLGRYEPTN